MLHTLTKYAKQGVFVGIDLPSDREYISRHELAIIFNVSEATVRRWCLPVIKAGRRRLYRVDDVRRWLNERRAPAA